MLNQKRGGVILSDPQMRMDAAQAETKTKKTHLPPTKTKANAYDIINSMPLFKIKIIFRLVVLTQVPFSFVYDFSH